MDPHVEYSEKNVVMYRDENGTFGMRIGGQNPVFVDRVMVDGPAWRAGVRKDDLIIMVDGILVSAFDHNDVVDLICSREVVSLTLHTPELVFSSSNSSCG
jgi:C-terminal processing protease CtpA/Prc